MILEMASLIVEKAEWDKTNSSSDAGSGGPFAFLFENSQM